MGLHMYMLTHMHTYIHTHTGRDRLYDDLPQAGGGDVIYDNRMGKQQQPPQGAIRAMPSGYQYGDDDVTYDRAGGGMWVTGSVGGWA